MPAANDRTKGNYIALAPSLGMMWGVALGFGIGSFLGNGLWGISLGAAVGAALGALISVSKRRTQVPSSERK